MIARCYLLSYDINHKKNKNDLLLPVLEKAKEYQMKAIKRAQVDNPDLLDEYRNTQSM